MGATKFIPPVLLVIVFVFTIAATATAGWSKINFGQDNLEGPWVVCLAGQSCQTLTSTTDFQNTYSCDSTSINLGLQQQSTCDSLQTVRAFSVISVIVSFITLLAAVFASAKSHGEASVGAGALAIFTSLTLLITWAVWVGTAEHNKSQITNSGGTETYGYSIGLLIVAWLLSIVSGVVSFLIKGSITSA